MFRLVRLIGVEQWRSRHLREASFQVLMRSLIVILNLPVLLFTVYYLHNFARSEASTRLYPFS